MSLVELPWISNVQFEGSEFDMLRYRLKHLRIVIIAEINIIFQKQQAPARALRARAVLVIRSCSGSSSTIGLFFSKY